MSDNEPMAIYVDDDEATSAMSAAERVKRAAAMVQGAGDRASEKALVALLDGRFDDVCAVRQQASTISVGMALIAAPRAQEKPEDVPDDVLNAAARLARAERHIGRERSDISRWVRLDADEVGAPAIARAAERLRAGEPTGPASISAHAWGVADSTRQVVCRIRAALRNPGAFALNETTTSAERISVPADAATLDALLGGPWSHLDHSLQIAQMPGGRRRVMMIGFRNRAGRRAVAEVWAPLDHDAPAPNLPIYRLADGAVPERVCTFSLADRRAGSPTYPDPTYDESVFGADVCAHAAATWEPQALEGFPVDSLRLDCPECLRHRIQVAPLHRVVAGAYPIEDEGRYLQVMRYHAALEGRDLGADSVADLRATEEPINMDPAAYRIGKRTGAPRTLADIMRRRRR